MTNTNMEIFNNEEFGEVRAIVINGEPWFVGRDVAESLGYANTKDALITHTDPEDRQILKRSAEATFEIPNRGLTIVNESGLYSLILSCQLPKGKRFKKWITSEVLPSLRKNGIYVTDPLMRQIAKNPNYLYALWDTLEQQNSLLDSQTEVISEQQERIAEKDERIGRQENLIMDMSHVVFMQDVEIEEKDEIIGNMSWKAEYYDKHVDAGDGVPTRVLAKQLEISEKYLVSVLIGCRFLYRCGGHLLPYADRRCAGMFKVRESETLVTPKGKDKIFKVVEALRFEQKAAV